MKMKKIFGLLFIAISSAFYSLYGDGGEIRFVFEADTNDFSLSNSLGFTITLSEKDKETLIQYINNAKGDERCSDWLLDYYYTLLEESNEIFFNYYTFKRIKSGIKNSTDVALFLFMTIQQKTYLPCWVLKEYDLANILKNILGEESIRENANLFAWLEVINLYKEKLSNKQKRTDAVIAYTYDPYDIFFENGISSDILLEQLKNILDKLFPRNVIIYDVTKLEILRVYKVDQA